MKTLLKQTAFWSILVVALVSARSAAAQAPTINCTFQLNALKNVLIFIPAPDESIGGNRVLYHWYPVTGTDFFIRTDHWDGDAVLVEGPLFLGPYDLVEPVDLSVPPEAAPLCFNYSCHILPPPTPTPTPSPTPSPTPHDHRHDPNGHHQ